MRKISTYIWAGLKLLLICAGGVLLVTLRYILKTPQPLESALPGEAHLYKWKRGHVYYKVAGAAEAPPVVLWHAPGVGAAGYEMRHLHRQLMEQYRVYTPDLLGFGNSDHPAGPYTADLYTAFLRDFLMDVVGRPATLVASGLSNNYCVAVAAQEPQFCSRVILLSPLTVFEKGKRSALVEKLTRSSWLGFVAYATLTARPLLQGIVNERYVGRVAASPAELDLAYAAAHQLGAHRAVLALWSGVLDLDVTNLLGRLSQPVSIIWGEYTAHALVPERGGTVIAGAGLRPHEEQPEKVLASMRETIARQASEQAQKMPPVTIENTVVPENRPVAAISEPQVRVVEPAISQKQVQGKDSLIQSESALPEAQEEHETEGGEQQVKVDQPPPAASVEKAEATQQEGVEAYCVKCKQKRSMQGARKITTKNGRSALEGICPVCGTRLFRFIAG